MFHAGLWTLALRVFLRGATFIRTIVLARLLAPEDFGLFGIALLSVYVLETFTHTGANSALVQRKDDIRPYLNTAWTIEVFRGLSVAVTLVLLAPLAASFFRAPEAETIIRVIAATQFINGFNNTGIVYFQKDLELHRRFLHRGAYTATEVGVAIGLATVLSSAWALVYGLLAGSIAQLVASYLLHPYRPRFEINWARAKAIYSFGIWVTLGQIVALAALKADHIVVGRVLGPAALGIYEIAQRVPDAIRVEIRDLAQAVAFPAYSKLQGDTTRLRWAFHQTVETVAAAILPFAAVLALLAPELTHLVLGPKWMSGVPVIQVLALAGAVRAIQTTSEPLLFGTGRPRLSFHLHLFRALALAALVYPFTAWWGLTGAAWAVTISICCAIPLQLAYAQAAVSASTGELLRPLLLPLVLTAGVAGSILAVREFTEWQGVPMLVWSLAAAGGVYFSILVLSWRLFGAGPLELINRVRVGHIPQAG